MNWTVLGFIFLAYLCGSIPFGKLAGKRRGVDIQKKGSGNTGFANAVRVLGWRTGLIVLAGDILKGFMPVLCATYYIKQDLVLAVGLAAVIGHVFPVWLKFHGGKGIATGLGVTLVIAPIAGLAVVVIYGLSVAILKNSGQASLIAACSLPLLCWIFYPSYIVFYACLAVFAIWTHRANLKSMMKRL